MPTDENNGVSPQNQQVDPNLGGNQSVQNSGDSDDFDFSFEDSNANQSGNGLSGDMQDQMKRQGRSGMFLTPDEAVAKSSDDSDMSFGNIDVSSTVQPQKRSGMFLTPDEEATKEESQIEGKQYSFAGDGDAGAQSDGSDDSYLAGIDPSDVEEDQSETNYDGPSSTQEDSTQETLDAEIEDLISFGNDQPSNNTNTGDSVSTQDDNSSQENMQEAQNNVVSDENVQADQNVEPVQDGQQTQEIGQVTPVDNNVGSESTGADSQSSGNSEDWLSKEDQRVEETFGAASEPVSPDIDVSPENVSQNVENVINESTDMDAQNMTSNASGNVNLEENAQPTEQSDLHIENMGTDVVENGNGDLISDTGGMQQISQENTYVPNETEFSQMSNILNSASTGPVDLSNANTESVQQSDSSDSSFVNLSDNTSVNDTAADNTVINNTVVDNTVTDNTVANNTTDNVESNNSVPVQESVLENSVNSELGKFEGQSQGESNVTQNVQLGATMSESNPVVNNENSMPQETSAEIDLDSLVVQTPGNIQENNQNNGAAGESVIGAVNNGSVNGSVSSQSVPVKRKKKQSGFAVLGIFLGIVVVLAGLCFAASKMFPDKFAKIFKKDDIVMEFLGGNGVNDIDENNPDEENPDDIDENNPDEENPDDIEIPGDDIDIQEPDPDSLAGLLSGDEDGGDDIEIGSGEETGGDDVETGDVSGEDESGVGSGENGEFDPFSGINDVIGDDQENKDKLNSYILKGQCLQGQDGGAPKFGDYIVNSVQDQLTKLENGEEIDTTLFDKFDEILNRWPNCQI